MSQIEPPERQTQLPPAPQEPRPPQALPFSPRWSASTKLVVGLSLVALFAFLLFRFLNIVGPLILAFILAYLFYPAADWTTRRLKIPWRLTVSLLYLLLLLLVLGSMTYGGFTVVDQVQNLIGFLTNAVEDLPEFLAEITSQAIQIGPFVLDLSQLDVNDLTNRVLGVVQPLLTRAGSSVVSVASGAATLLGWIFFILLVSYFILVESGGFRLFSLSIPGYAEDMRRLGAQLSRIWNAFLRGQITIVLMTVGFYTVMLGALGMDFYFGLALLAGVARFVPYVGPFVTWTTYGLVAFFQGSTLFGISPLGYVGLVVGLAWLVDVVLDNYVTPRLMSNALRVHPAAVMVSALVAFNLLGVIGVVLAAPVLATVKLILDYLFAKLFDRDPWEGMATIAPPVPFPISRSQLSERFHAVREKLTRRRPTGVK
jgi:predicted PurR-regulated permease PerM